MCGGAKRAKIRALLVREMNVICIKNSVCAIHVCVCVAQVNHIANIVRHRGRAAPVLDGMLSGDYAERVKSDSDSGSGLFLCRLCLGKAPESGPIGPYLRACANAVLLSGRLMEILFAYALLAFRGPQRMYIMLVAVRVERQSGVVRVFLCCEVF